MPQKLILQMPDGDYDGSRGVEGVIALLAEIESSTSESLYFTVYLDRVVLRTPKLLAAYRRSIGWLVWIHEASKESGAISYIAKFSDDRTPINNVRVVRQWLAVPQGYFLPQNMTAECVRHFAETGSRRPGTIWSSFDTLRYEFYTDLNDWGGGKVE